MNSNFFFIILIILMIAALSGCGLSPNTDAGPQAVVGKSKIYAYPQENGVICYSTPYRGEFSCVKVSP